MVDKIDNAGLAPRRLDSSSRGQASGQVDGGKSPVQASGAEAQQPGSTTFERLQQAVKGADSVDHDKIAEIKAAIGRGEYAIDARKIAGAVVDLERLLVNS